MTSALKRAILLIMMVAAVGAAGCGATTPEPTPEPTPSPTDAVTSATPPSTLDEAALTAALDALSGYESGTAGSSLKIYIAAAKLLNFCETYDTSQKEAAGGAIGAYLDGLSPDALDGLRANLPAILDTAQDIVDGGEQSKAMLSDAGDPQEYDAYRQEPFDAVKALLNEKLK